MKHRNAAAVLPAALLRELQGYVQGGYLYVPARRETHRAWGEVSGSRRELDRRNEGIRAKRRQGAALEDLAQEYHLSVSAIRKIVYPKP